MISRATPPAPTGFARSEEGGLTILSLFLFLGMLIAAGLAVDFSNMVQARQQLQGAADAAGHAALYWRWRSQNESDAIDKAVEVAQANMPTNRFGNVLANVDVEFGWWDPTEADPKDRFKPDATHQTAARVTTRRATSNSNALGTFLIKLVGKDDLDVNIVSVWDHEEGWCPRGEGFFAVDVVDIQSNNYYYDGFCIHSETHVEMNNNNTLESGVKVTMPDQADFVVPSGGLDPAKNPGLAEALDSVTYNLNAFFSDLPDLISSYQDPSDPVNSALTDTTVYSKKMTKNVTADDIEPGAVNYLTCKGKTLTIDNNVVISNAVVITPCEVKFNAGAAIENATLITTDTGSKSISAPSGFRVGATNYCSSGTGGANLITMGDMTVASGFEAYGANVIADGNISITSNADGLAGINFMSHGRIDATANGDLGFCNEGPPVPFQIPVFRMVM